MDAEKPPVLFHVETDREADGRWIAEVVELPGALAYGATEAEAVARAKALALRALADRLEHGETSSDATGVHFAAA